MMTDRQHIGDNKKANLTRIALQLLAGGAFGFFSMLALDYLIDLDKIFDVLTVTQIIALSLAIMFALIAFIVFVLSFNRRLFMLNRKQGDDTSEEEFSKMQPMLRWSAICIMFYSAALILLAMASDSSDAPQILSFWGVVAAMAAQTAISVHLWNSYDELYRDVTKESCAVAFVMIELLLFIWAAAAMFGMGVVFDPLGVVVAITAIYWAVSIWFITRRGLAQ